MVEHSRYLNFVDESLSPVLLWKCSFLSERFYCHFFLVFQLNAQIYSCEIALSESFLGFEKFMKVELIEKFTEFYLPFFDILDIIAVKLFRLVLGTHKLDSIGNSENFFLSFGFWPHNLENGIESDDKSFPSLTVFRIMIKEAFGC